MVNLSDNLFWQARERGDKVALIYEEDKWTFTQIAETVKRYAGGLKSCGVEPGTRVALMCSSRPEFIFMQQAVYALGATLIPLNIFYRRLDLLHALSCCDVEILIIDREYVENLPNPKDLPSLRKILAFGGEVEGADPAEAVPTLGTPITATFKMHPASVGMMLNTSATTGKAKAVMLSVANLQANYDPTAEWLGLDENCVILCVLPLYNTFGLNQGINAMLVSGGTLVLLPKFDADVCLNAIEQHGCTFLPMVPTMLQRIVDHPGGRPV